MLKPVSPSRWDFSMAAHLLNRAGFGGTPGEIQKLVELGPEKAVDSLVFYERIPDPAENPSWAKPDPARFARFKQLREASPQKRQQMRREEQRAQRQNLLELRQWWLERMASGPRPLQEKLTLFWHGHFATSAQKVRNATLMWRQNEIFRRHGSGHWLNLLTVVSKDPAMLVWLDQAQSRKEHPNENFAREVMELFTLGEGHYTEKDITEAARAFTGWSFDRLNEEYIFRPAWHDAGVKTVLGRTGNLSGDDVLKTIVVQPQAARFIARKLWVFFANENPSEALVNSLAAHFRAGGYHFKPLLRAMFLSEAFYAPEVVRQQVKSPVQWLVSSVRMLERDLPSVQACAAILRSLGQDLLLPPNVKGWDGGLSWITTNNLINRYNFAAALVLGEDSIRRAPRRRRGPAEAPVEIKKLFAEEVRSDPVKLLEALQLRFLQAGLKSKSQSALRAYLDSQGTLDGSDILQAIRLIMSTPEFQLT